MAMTKLEDLEIYAEAQTRRATQAEEAKRLAELQTMEAGKEMRRAQESAMTAQNLLVKVMAREDGLKVELKAAHEAVAGLTERLRKLKSRRKAAH
jgi:hypothetical protein